MSATVARAQKALVREQRRLHAQAEALRVEARSGLARLHARIVERVALTGPSEAERRDALRDQAAIEERMRELASVTRARLRGFEVAYGRLAARERELSLAGARIAEARARLALEKRLARWRREDGEVQPQPLADVSAFVDDAIGRAEASVARAQKAVGRQEARIGRDADALTLARDGSLPEFEALTPNDEVASLAADDWEALRVAAQREVAGVKLDATALSDWLEEAGPRAAPTRPMAAMSNLMAFIIGGLGCVALILGGLFVREHAHHAAPMVAARALVDDAVLALAAAVAGAVTPAAAFAVTKPGKPPEQPAPLGTPPPADEHEARGTLAEAAIKLVLGSRSVDVDIAPPPAPRPARKAKNRGASLYALRATIERSPKDTRARVQLAARLEALGNPMGALRHLDYLRTLDSDAARRALATAAAKPELARWLAPGWWSAATPEALAPADR